MNQETEKLLQCQVCAWEVGKHLAVSCVSGQVESCLCLEGGTWDEAGAVGGVRNCTANTGGCSASSCSPREALSVLPEALAEGLEEWQSRSFLVSKAVDDPSSNLGMYPEDEWNLLYVAVTRAKKYLLMSESLEHLLTLAGVSEILPR